MTVYNSNELVLWWFKWILLHRFLFQFGIQTVVLQYISKFKVYF